MYCQQGKIHTKIQSKYNIQYISTSVDWQRVPIICDIYPCVLKWVNNALP